MSVSITDSVVSLFADQWGLVMINLIKVKKFVWLKGKVTSLISIVVSVVHLLIHENETKFIAFISETLMIKESIPLHVFMDL